MTTQASIKQQSLQIVQNKEQKQISTNMDQKKKQQKDQKQQKINENSKQEQKESKNQIKQLQKQFGEMKITQEQKNHKDEDHQSENQANSKKSSQKGDESQQVTQTKYFVQINRNSIAFGKNTLFPGSIEQIDIAIGLKDDIIEDNGNNNPFMLRVIAKCNNQQFNDLDEYVFSVRSNQRFQYFQEVRFKIKKKQRAQVKVAVKIPPVKNSYIIDGVLEVQLESLQPVFVPICAKCQVPQIVCIKDLYKPDQDTQVIKIPAKKNQIRMPPIPFKNLSGYNFTLEVQAISNENFANRAYDVITQNFVNCQANTQFFVNMQLKQNMQYKGPLPTRDVIRKILILKIKNSSVYYNYPMEVQIFESSNQNSMS